MDYKPARQTFYNGTLFKSQLEAKWAVFFDTLNIEWVYEPCVIEHTDVYTNRKLCYKPDFYLPRLGLYVEVKPTWERLIAEGGKISTLIDWGNSVLSYNGLLILGQIPYWDYRNDMRPEFMVLSWYKGVSSRRAYFDYGYDEHNTKYFFVRQSDDVCDIADSPSFPDPFYDEFPEKLYDLMPEKSGTDIINAFREANSARFNYDNVIGGNY